MKFFFNMFGFDGMQDFVLSTFGVFLAKNSLLVSLTIGVLAGNIERFVGLEPVVFLAVICLFVLEIITGITASVFFKKEPFDKEKLGRSIVKLVAYPVLLSLIHNFQQFDIGSIDVFGFGIDFFSIAHTALVFLVILQVLISFLENLTIMGFKELELITKIFKVKLNIFTKKVDKEKENSYK